MAVGGAAVSSAISGTISLIFWLVGGVVLIVGAIFLGKKRKEKQSFNIPVTIFIPRSDNKTRDIIEAKGGYFKSQAVGGITTFRLKRKGVGTIEIPPPGSRFLVGFNRRLFLVQKGMDDFEPVLPESFGYVDCEVAGGDGKKNKVAVINLKCVNQDATAWKNDNEQNAKKRFTFSSFWEKHQVFIQITIFILIVFIASYVQYNGLKGIADKLEVVARVLGPAISNAPVVG